MTDNDIERYRAAHAREQLSRADWIEAVLEQAEILHRKRGEMDDKTFGAWLCDNGVNELHSKDDRAALIGFGSDLVLAREVLTTTTRISPRLIWKDALLRFRNGANPGETIKSLVLAALLQCGKEGRTAGELAEDLQLARRQVENICSDGVRDGKLIKTETKRGGNSHVYMHREFVANRRKNLPPIERVQHETWKPREMTREELGRPKPEEAHLPDSERPGLTREQAYVANYGQVQIMPMKERKRSITRRLNTIIRKLDEPLTEYVEQAAILLSAEELAELLPTLENSAKTRQRIREAVRAVKDNLRRSCNHIEQLEAALEPGSMMAAQ